MLHVSSCMKVALGNLAVFELHLPLAVFSWSALKTVHVFLACLQIVEMSYAVMYFMSCGQTGNQPSTIRTSSRKRFVLDMVYVLEFYR